MPGGCILYLQPAPAGLWKPFTTRFGRCCCKGLFLVDGQALACNGLGILGKQGRGNGLNSFAVQAGAGEVGHLDFVASYLQVVGIVCGDLVVVGGTCVPLTVTIAYYMP